MKADFNHVSALRIDPQSGRSRLTATRSVALAAPYIFVWIEAEPNVLSAHNLPRAGITVTASTAMER